MLFTSSLPPAVGKDARMSIPERLPSTTHADMRFSSSASSDDLGCGDAVPSCVPKRTSYVQSAMVDKDSRAK
jgi:hypothetical protein